MNLQSLWIYDYQKLPKYHKNMQNWLASKLSGRPVWTTFLLILSCKFTFFDSFWTFLIFMDFYETFWRYPHLNRCFQKWKLVKKTVLCLLSGSGYHKIHKKNHKKYRSVPSKLQVFKILKKSAKVSYALKYWQKTSKMIKKSEI